MSSDSDLKFAPVASRKRKYPPPEEELSWRMDPTLSHSDWTIEIAAFKSTPNDSSAAYSGSSTNDETKVILSTAKYCVHKAMLSVGSRKSTYFERLFQNKNLREHETRTSYIELEEIAAKAFPVFLDYLYGNELAIDSLVNAVALDHLSQYFGVSCLQTRMQQYWDYETVTEAYGSYFQQAKIVRDETIIQMIVKKVVQNIEKIGSTSKLLRVSDVQFWLDVLNENRGKPMNPRLSFILARFMVNQQQLHAETFRTMTDKDILPVVGWKASIFLLQLEKKLLFQDGESIPTELTCLQERCVDALAKNFVSLDGPPPEKIEEDLVKLGPHLLAKVMMRSAKYNKPRIVAAQTLLPSSVVLSGAGFAAVNGVYSRTDNYYCGAPRFVMLGTVNGNPAQFEIFLVSKSDGSRYWLVAVVPNGTASPVVDGSVYFYFSEPVSQNDLLLPPKSLWQAHRQSRISRAKFVLSI